jgi:hypothetical protein
MARSLTSSHTFHHHATRLERCATSWWNPKSRAPPSACRRSRAASGSGGIADCVPTLIETVRIVHGLPVWVQQTSHPRSPRSPWHPAVRRGPPGAGLNRRPSLVDPAPVQRRARPDYRPGYVPGSITHDPANIFTASTLACSDHSVGDGPRSSRIPERDYVTRLTLDLRRDLRSAPRPPATARITSDRRSTGGRPPARRRPISHHPR